MTHPFGPLARTLAHRRVRYVLIGVSGANLYGPSGQAIFSTEDIDLFLPADADNLVQAWAACADAEMGVSAGDEPLGEPRDRWLADRVIQRRALTRARGPHDLLVDLTLVMQGFDFDTVWTARLLHIVESKQATGRDKDKLFLATHFDALQQLLHGSDED